MTHPIAVDLTFTPFTDGALRRFDLRGPAGMVRFETTDAQGLVPASAAIYLHFAAAPKGGEQLEDCDACGKCRRDVALGRFARNLRKVWRESSPGRDLTLIRVELERWYNNELRGEATS